MATGSSKYEVKIETPADTTGAQKTAQALDKTTESVKKLEAAGKKLNEGQKENTAGMDKQTGVLTRMMTLWGRIGEIVRVVIRAYKEFTDKVDEMIAATNKLTDTFRTYYELVEKNRQSDIDFDTRLANIGKTAANTAEHLTSVNTAMEKTLSLESNEDAASKKLALAQVAQQLKTGQIDDGAAAGMRNDIERQFAARAEDRESRRAAGRVTNLGNAKRMAEEARLSAEQALPGARAEREDAQKILAKSQGELKAMEGGINFKNQRLKPEEAEMMRAKLARDVAGYEDALNATGGIGPQGIIQRKLLTGAKTKLGDITDAIAGYHRGLDQQRATIVQAQGRSDLASRRVDSLEGEIISRTQDRNKYGRQYETAVTEENQAKASRARVREAESAAADLDEAGAIIKQAVKDLAKELRDAGHNARREIQR